MSFLIYFSTALITTILGVIAIFKWAFKYWETKGVPGETPAIPVGNMADTMLQKESFGEGVYKCYQQAKKAGHKHTGLFAFWKPIYMPIDLKIVKSILGKDFNHFVDRGFYYNEIDDPLSATLFTLEGNKWRNLRAKLTPTFTSGKMKMMFPTLIECASNLNHAMEEYVLTKEPIEIRDVLSRYTTDVIGSCAFGLECNSFKNPNSDFRKYGNLFLHQTLAQQLKNFVAFCAPGLARRMGVTVLLRSVTDFFTKVTYDTVRYREENNVKRNDFLQLLIELKNDSSDYSDANQVMKGLTIDEMAAQLFLFFIAGFETSSTTMTFCLYELALNPDIQERVRSEITNVTDENDGKITYESIASMKYLEQVIDETLRKYPPVPVLNRTCVADYTIPGTNITIENGIPVFISVLGIHRDSEYFFDPEKFDPERFSDENKATIVHSSYLPFGDGPRNCIGLRFGMMQVKVGLAMLLKTFTFSVNNKTDFPLKLDPTSFIMSAKNGIWLHSQKVDQ